MTAPYQFSFEKLAVWQLSRELAVTIYKRTRTFPGEERYSLTSQLRRAAVSVTANIAEGTTRTSAKDQARFTTIAYSSLMEVFNHLIIATDLDYVNEEELITYKQKIQALSVKLSNLKTSQIKRVGKLSFLWLLIVSPMLCRPIVPLN